MGSPAAPLFDLSGAVALVTGASSGIGLRMAQALSGAGAAVVLAARRKDELIAAAEGIAAVGGRVDVAVADLANRPEISKLAAAAARPFGAPGILVNAAGINLRQAAEDVTFDSWDRTLAVNLTAPFFLARAMVPAMIAAGRGKIVNVISLQSVRAFPNGIAYGASKGGLAQLTRAMAEAWSPKGVTCNGIAPGFFPTALTAAVFDDPDVSTMTAKATAVGRNGRMDDLDGTAIFLAAPASDYLTGQILFVDGGFTAK